jgi:hypothetical protein
MNCNFLPQFLGLKKLIRRHRKTPQHIESTYIFTILVNYRRVLDWWPSLLDTLIQRATIIYSALLHTCKYSVTSSLPLLGNGFQRRIFPFLRVPEHMKTSFHSLNSFLSLFCSCQFQRLDSIKFLFSQDHIAAGWCPETRLFTSDSTIVLLCRTFLITTLQGPRSKQSLYY